MLNIVAHLWGEKYSDGYLDKLVAGVRRHLKQRHRFILMTERERAPMILPSGVERHAIKDPELTKIKGCFARLRLFDPEWQRRRDIKEGERIVSIDLDTIITGPLDPLFDRPESFLIMQGGNAANPCPFCGAMFMLRAGALPEVWNEFSLEEAQKAPRYEFPDDQGFLWYKIGHAAGWKCGVESGVLVFQKPGWPGSKSVTALPHGARLVTFTGPRDPSQLTHLDWVREHWRV